MLNANARVIVILTTISITITLLNYQVIFAPFDNDNERSILPKYREGYEVGKVQGSKDNISEDTRPHIPQAYSCLSHNNQIRETELH